MGTWAEWWAGEASIVLFLLANLAMINFMFCIRCGMNIVQTTIQISFSGHFIITQLNLFKFTVLLFFACPCDMDSSIYPHVSKKCISF